MTTRAPRPLLPAQPLTRRTWLALAAGGAAAATLNACGGGGGGSLSVSLPGTGGTGIYAEGPISGFGSVIVNGVRFDDSSATVLINGSTATSADLRLGMMAGITGQRPTTGAATGTAASIEVWAAAQGPVTAVASGQISVMGLVVQSDAGTTLDGVSALSDLRVGQWVGVWGLQSASAAGTWTATRVATVSSANPTALTTGRLQVAGTRRTLNGLTLSGAALAPAQDGQLLRVRGTLDTAGTSLLVDQVQWLDGSNAPVPQGEAELEGVITAQVSATRFTVGRTTVDLPPALAAANASALKVGARIEVSGTWQASGVLLATTLEVSGPAKAQSVELEARIEQYTSLANFVVRGQRCDGTGATITGGTTSQLRAGVKVSVKGVKNGDVLRVSAIEIED